MLNFFDGETDLSRVNLQEFCRCEVHRVGERCGHGPGPEPRDSAEIYLQQVCVVFRGQYLMANHWLLARLPTRFALLPRKRQMLTKLDTLAAPRQVGRPGTHALGKATFGTEGKPKSQLPALVASNLAPSCNAAETPEMAEKFTISRGAASTKKEEAAPVSRRRDLARSPKSVDPKPLSNTQMRAGVVRGLNPGAPRSADCQ